MGDGFAQARKLRHACGHCDQFKPESMRQQIVEMQNAIALFGAKIPHGEQAGEPSPAGTVARIDEDVGRSVGEYEPRARVIA